MIGTRDALSNTIPLGITLFALSKDAGILGLPLDFPGSGACFRSASQATGIGLPDRSMAWTATTPQYANEPFGPLGALAEPRRRRVLP